MSSAAGASSRLRVCSLAAHVEKRARLALDGIDRRAMLAQQHPHVLRLHLATDADEPRGEVPNPHPTPLPLPAPYPLAQQHPHVLRLHLPSRRGNHISDPLGHIRDG